MPAPLANTFLTTAAVGNREELSDVVSRITPEDTPIYSLIEKGKCVSVHPEWETDELAPPAANIQTEGGEYDFDAITPPARLGDYTQIMSKDWIISNTQEVVDNAGNAEKRKYQKLKKGIEIRKDVEYAIVDINASVGGATREFGSLPTWLETNVNRGALGTNGGFDPVTGLTMTPGAGTPRALTKVIMDDVMEKGYNSGANFKHVVMSPYLKSVFVGFMSDPGVAQFRYAVTKGGERNTIIASADYYEGPFGTVMVHPNRVMATTVATSSNALFLDLEFIEFLWLRKIQEDPDIAKTGDAKKGVIIGEGTLKVKNEKGLGVAADLIGLRP